MTPEPKPKPTLDPNDIVAVIGAALLVTGVAVYSVPVALIVAGVLLMTYAYLAARPEAKKPDAGSLVVPVEPGGNDPWMAQ